MVTKGNNAKSLANAQTPYTVYKLDAFQGLGCTQLNLYGDAQKDAYGKQGYKVGTCNGAGYGRPAGCAGQCSMGTQWLQ